jgi:hypothetical protein
VLGLATGLWVRLDSERRGQQGLLGRCGKEEEKEELGRRESFQWAAKTEIRPNTLLSPFSGSISKLKDSN